MSPPMYPGNVFFWIEFTPSDAVAASWLEMFNAKPYPQKMWDDLRAAIPSFIRIYDIAKKDDAYHIAVFFSEKEPINSHEVKEWALEAKKKTLWVIDYLRTVISAKWFNANYGHLREELET